jgi:4-diphosphocytidyl-2-C-methyl-D-erythritol kinase
MKYYRAYAKVNIFLKITAKRGDYHEILSRFMRVNTLYDELSFIKKEEIGANERNFVILGDFSCTTEQNTIFKAFQALQRVSDSEALERLMQSYAIKVEKSIPAFAGLGGGSSDAATYLKMCNEVLHLGLSNNELATIGLEVGADVPFFIYDYSSANVSGIGEIVEPYKEDIMQIETITPPIEIVTSAVYNEYRKNFYAPIQRTQAQYLKECSSKELLSSLHPKDANDLFAPALKLYPDLEKYAKDGWFFSGSGSSFFRIKKDNNG